MKKTCLALLLILLFTSCAVKHRTPVVTGKISGLYKNAGHGEYSLWSNIDPQKDTMDTCFRCYVKIEVLSNHNVRATLLNGNQTLKSIKYKGRVKHHQQILIKRKTVIAPDYVILWAWAYSKNELCVDEHGDIIVKKTSWGYTAIVFLPFFAAENKIRDQHFERVSD